MPPMMTPPESGILTPDELTAADVDALVDPGATGVPELAPTRARHLEIARLEEGLADASGEELLLGKARLAYVCAPLDLPRARTLQAEVLTAARESGSLVAELEALCALLSVMRVFRDEDEYEAIETETRALELAAHLDLPLYQAGIYLDRATNDALITGNSREALRLTWQARELALKSSQGGTLRAAVLGMVNLQLARLAWIGEQNVDLLRRYSAVAIAYLRHTETASEVAFVHLGLGMTCMWVGDLANARRHLQRLIVIAQHHHETMASAGGVYWLGRAELEQNDIERAKRSLQRLRDMLDQDKSGSVFQDGERILSGLIAEQSGEPAEAVRNLEQVTGTGLAIEESRISIYLALARAHEQLGDYARANDSLKTALSLHQDMHRGRAGTVTSGFIMSDEIRKLRDEHSELSLSAERNASLLEAILPPSAYREVERNGSCEARFYSNIAILFLDFAGFTKIASGMPPEQLVQILSQLYDAFDEIMDAHACERVETIGDAYLALAGLDQAGESEDADARVASRMTEAALDIARHLRGRNAEFEALGSPRFEARIGVHVGSVIGGLVGSRRLRFAVFGDAVNTTQRLEAGGRPGRVTVSEPVALALQDHPGIVVQPREGIPAKGKGLLTAFEVEREQPASVDVD
jgi:class 3 adenylate cyclase